MKCPGQDMKYWKEDAIFDIDCPHCGKSVEFYKDDTSRKCNHCGHRFVNPKLDFGCATYCQFAEQCLGTLPEDFQGVEPNSLLKEKLAVAVKRYYRTDFKSIREATNCAQFAETIGKANQASLPVVLCASYLHGIATDTAKELLDKAGAAPRLTDEICAILQKIKAADTSSSPAVQILHDALILVQIQQLRKDGGSSLTGHAADFKDTFFTSEAARIADSLCSPR